MPLSAHISTSEDNSLEERIRNYKSAYKAYEDVEASNRFSANKEWQNTLGTEEEIQQAKAIIKNSLEISVKAISNEDRKMALQAEMITEKENSQLQALSRDPAKITASKEEQVLQNKEKISEARANSKSKSRDNDKSRD